MRIFVAGATGVLGRRIVPRLVAAGHEVTAATRSAAKADALRDAGAAPVLVDVFDREALRRAVADAAPDLVMHQLTDLGGGSTEANARIRVTGTRNLVDAAAGAGVPKMVAQSISWVYQAGDGPADESVPLDLNAAAPRSGTVQGVAALEAAVESLDWPSGVVNVCDDEPAPGREWVPAFCRAVGAPAPPPAPAATRGRDGWARGADNRHARNDLGWKPRYPSWRTGFGEPET